jgi:hypothetical protein
LVYSIENLSLLKTLLYKQKIKKIIQKKSWDCVNNRPMNEIDLKKLQFDRQFRIHKIFTGSVAWLLLFEIIT